MGTYDKDKIDFSLNPVSMLAKAISKICRISIIKFRSLHISKSKSFNCIKVTVLKTQFQ